MGRCPDCGEWATLTEEAVIAPTPAERKRTSVSVAAPPQRLDGVDLSPEDRVTTGLEELDRVLGGGLVGGSLVLIGGDPGIGKSTLLLQVSANLARQGIPVLYISGEESPRQIKMRAARLGAQAEGVWISSETDAALLGGLVESCGAQAMVIDSVQTMFDPASNSAPGTVSQVRGATALIAAAAKPLVPHLPAGCSGGSCSRTNPCGSGSGQRPTALAHRGDRRRGHRPISPHQSQSRIHNSLRG